MLVALVALVGSLVGAYVALLLRDVVRRRSTHRLALRIVALAQLHRMGGAGFLSEIEDAVNRRMLIRPEANEVYEAMTALLERRAVRCRYPYEPDPYYEIPGEP